ncbi:beta strand repeat-containing protein, partial [Colwellia sp. C1TZA3]|uniref:beta strand repeat-containing protein n=1 Tax=Colwellia sp. C1TZA3 TaxID=2508879 RepID=UPI00398397F9
TSFTNNTSITNASPGNITIHFEASDGSDLANEVISFTSTLGLFDPKTGTVLTNSTGDATITLSAGTVRGAGVVTASSSAGDAVTQGFFTQGDSSEEDGNALTITSFTNNTSITNASPGNITIHFEASDGSDLANEVISFTSTLGLFDPKAGTVLTNSTGDATITLLAGTVRGAGVVTASSSAGDAVTQGFFTQGDGSEEDGNALTITSFTNNTSITNASPGNITIHFEASDGSDLANEVISFTSTLGLFDPKTGTVLTNSTGDATITLSAGTVRGAGVVTASSSAGDAVTQGFFTQGDSSAEDGNALTITSFTNNTSITNASPGNITIHFEASDGSDLANEVISFTSTLGLFDPKTGTVLTNSTGDATITLSAGTVRGAGVVTASSSAGDVVTQGFFTEGNSVGSGFNISLILTDTNGNEVEQISSISSGKLVATVTGVSKAVIVTFTTDLGTIPVQTAIATTGNGYIATVDLLAGNSLGAGTVIAQLVTGESEQLVFSIGASSLSMGNAIDSTTGLPDGLIDVPVGDISAGATAGLSVSIWDVSNASVSTPAVLFTTETVEVSFTSGCSRLTPATAKVDSPIVTIVGLAQSTYLAQGCEGNDIVTATANIGGSVLSATGTVSIASPDSGSIEFISATPTNISLKGVGGIESSTVVFRVKDTNGDLVANKDVNFLLNTGVGGIGLSPKVATTDSNGLVQTIVNSGTVHTSVRVRAELDEDSSIFTQSNLLVISTGIPDQDSFSLFANILNPEAWNIDGTKVTITARLADAFNNPVPDGTAVAFTTEGGVIEDSCVTTNGVCAVIWTSQNVRPEGQELGEVNDGPTLIKGTVDISKGFDFTDKEIIFSVNTTNGSDDVSLSSNFTSKAELLSATNILLNNSGIKAVSGFEGLFELISTEGLDIKITDISPGSVTTFDVLGITNGITYYNNATRVLGLNNISAGRDFTVNDIIFDVKTVDGTDSVTLDANFTNADDIVNEINMALTESSVVAAKLVYAGDSYLLLKSPTRLNIKITNGVGTSTLFAELGIADGTTFSSRVNSSSPQATNFMAQKYGGRVTILATAIGEESFPDFNGNGLYDQIEKDAFLGVEGNTGLDVNGQAYDVSESFIDYNEDGIYNPQSSAGDGETGGEQEKFDDFNSKVNTPNNVFDLKDSKYNGSLCGDADNCGTDKSIKVRGSLVLIMSDSTPSFTTTSPKNGASINISQDDTAAAAVTIADFHNQPMPAGTTVTFDAAVGSIKGISSYVWPNTNFNGGISFPVTVEGVKDQTISGPLVVTVRTPLGVATSYTVAIINITP